MEAILKRAILVKLKSKNGFFEAEDGIPIGKTYWVYPDSVSTGIFLHRETGQHHAAQIVWLEDGTFFPVELLRITSQEKHQPETIQ